MTYKFIVDRDPEYPECWSAWLDADGNGAEVVGKIHYLSIANHLANCLNILSQTHIKELFEGDLG